MMIHAPVGVVLTMRLSAHQAVFALGLLFKVAAFSDPEEDGLTNTTGIDSANDLLNGLGIFLVLLCTLFLLSAGVLGTIRLVQAIRQQQRKLDGRLSATAATTGAPQTTRPTRTSRGRDRRRSVVRDILDAVVQGKPDEPVALAGAAAAPKGGADGEAAPGFVVSNPMRVASARLPRGSSGHEASHKRLRAPPRRATLAPGRAPRRQGPRIAEADEDARL